MESSNIAALSRVVKPECIHFDSATAERDGAPFGVQSRAAVCRASQVPDEAVLGFSFSSSDARQTPYLDTKRLKCPQSEGFEQRKGRLGYAKKRAVTMANFLEDLAPRRAEKLKGCASYLLFRDYFTVGQMKLSAGMFCQQHLLCPLCARLRAGRVLRKYTERIEHVLKTENVKVGILTFTVKNGADLDERSKHLLSSFKTLSAKARKIRNGSRHVTEFSKFSGGVASMEVKRGAKSGLWHPHIHAVVLITEKVSMENLRAEWHEVTGDSMNVDLRLVNSSKNGQPEKLVEDLQEVFKYAMKFADMTIEDNWEAFRTLRGKRLLRPWGKLWGVKVPEDLTDENELSKDLPFTERLIIYRRKLGGYVDSTEDSERVWFKDQMARYGQAPQQEASAELPTISKIRAWPASAKPCSRIESRVSLEKPRIRVPCENAGVLL